MSIVSFSNAQSLSQAFPQALQSQGARPHGGAGRAGRSAVPAAPSQQAQQAQGSYQAASVQSASEQDGSLNITTAEGDTVKISFQALQAQQSYAFQAQAGAARESGSQSVSGGGSASSSSFSASIDVQGSLSDKELADIKKLITALGSAVKDAGTGDTAKVAQDLQQTGSLDSIQGFQFSYQQTSQYEANYQSGSLARSYSGSLANVTG